MKLPLLFMVFAYIIFPKELRLITHPVKGLGRNEEAVIWQLSCKEQNYPTFSIKEGGI